MLKDVVDLVVFVREVDRDVYELCEQAAHVDEAEVDVALHKQCNALTPVEAGFEEPQGDFFGLCPESIQRPCLPSLAPRLVQRFLVRPVLTGVVKHLGQRPSENGCAGVGCRKLCLTCHLKYRYCFVDADERYQNQAKRWQSPPTPSLRWANEQRLRYREPLPQDHPRLSPHPLCER